MGSLDSPEGEAMSAKTMTQTEVNKQWEQDYNREQRRLRREKIAMEKKMDLWELWRKGTTDYDEYEGFVVSATSAIEARKLCAKKAGTQDGPVWLSRKKSGICRLRPGKEAGIVLASNIGG